MDAVILSKIEIDKRVTGRRGVNFFKKETEEDRKVE